MSQKSENRAVKNNSGKKYVFILLLCGLASTGLTDYILTKGETEISLKAFKDVWSKKLDDQADKFKELFQMTYQSMRTIALLPGVARIDRYGTNFDGDPKITTQQIYNNLASQVAVSELYIVPLEFNPENIDLQTGKPEEPIVSFDEIIVGKSANTNSIAYQDIELEEVEIFEYRQFKAQLDFFKAHYATRHTISKMEFPLLISEEVITCDNTNFSSKDLENKNDTPRMGIALSVPFYDEEGNLKGLVTAVIRSIILGTLIDDPFFVLTNPSTNYLVAPLNLSEEVKPHLPKLIKNELPQDNQDIIFTDKRTIEIAPQSTLSTALVIPRSYWEQSDSYRSVINHSIMIWVLGSSLSLILSLIIGGLFYTRSRAVFLANQMASELEKSQKELVQSQKMDAIGQLAGGIAHDFNNILGVIMGYASLLKNKLKDSPKESQKVDNILNAAEKAKSLTGQILGFARKGQYEKRAVALNQAVSEAIRILAMGLNKNIEFKTSLTQDLWMFTGDPAQILQVILNIGVNALDAMPQGGTLTFETKNITVDDSYAATHEHLKPGNYVFLSVQDTGIGIPKEIQPKIFDPFFTTKDVGQGSGLGLSMVYGIIKNLKGYIGVYSEISQGSVFKLYFPADELSSQENLPQTASSEAQAVLNLEGQTVLIVDDEDAIRELGQMILEPTGAAILTAANGQIALDLFKSNKDTVSLVIIDAIMPELGGVEAYKQLIELNPNIHVLFCSGYSEDNQIAPLRTNPKVGFLQKPYTADSLINTIIELLKN